MHKIKKTLIKMASNAMKEEEAIASVYKSLCNKSDLVLDIGANYGYHTKLMAEVACEGSVICLEAHPQHAARLKKLYANSSIVQVINKALVPETIAHQHAITFRISDEFHGRGGVKGLHIWEKIDPSMEFVDVNVETVSLDPLLLSLPKAPSFIKMDIVGPEYSILDSSQLLGVDCRPECIAFENSVHGPSLGSINFENFCTKWTSQGYKFISVNGLLVENEQERRSAGRTLFLGRNDALPGLISALYAHGNAS